MPIPNNEYWRKSIHTAGVFLIPVLFWNRHAFTFILLAFLIFYLSVEALARRGIQVPFLSALTDHSKRPHEVGHLSRGALGLVGAGIFTPYFFGVLPAAVGLAQIFIADTASSLTGMTWGHRKLPYNPNKSWVGSLVFFGTAALVSRFFFAGPEAIVLALVGAVLESLPLGDWDNAVVPLVVALAAYLLQGF